MQIELKEKVLEMLRSNDQEMWELAITIIKREKATMHHTDRYQIQDVMAQKLLGQRLITEKLEHNPYFLMYYNFVYGEEIGRKNNYYAKKP